MIRFAVEGKNRVYMITIARVLGNNLEASRAALRDIVLAIAFVPCLHRRLRSRLRPFRRRLLRRRSRPTLVFVFVAAADAVSCDCSGIHMSAD